MPSNKPSRHASDLRGLNQLAIDAVTGTTDLVEGMHAAVTYLPAMLGRAAPDRTSGLTGWIYGRVRGAARLVGAGVGASLSTLAPVLGGDGSSAERDALLAAMNGVLGDHLDRSGNPLALEMAIRHGGEDVALTRKTLATAFPEAGGRVVVLLHGLCMNDRQWTFNGHDHGAALARDLGFVPLYLRYNSGRHISANGRAFAELMEQLCANWSVPIERLVLVGHSMGGLVARSAVQHAERMRHAWRDRLDDIVFLGTPHHGAPLERAGAYVDRLIRLLPYTAPFARIGGLRSAGIRDLRHGNVREGDWHDGGDETRVPLPLPTGVRCFAIATTTQAEAAAVAGKPLRGDGLVPIASALGRHPEKAFDLRFPKTRQWIGYRINHLELLGSAEVYARMRNWLARAPRRPGTQSA